MGSKRVSRPSEDDRFLIARAAVSASRKANARAREEGLSKAEKRQRQQIAEQAMVIRELADAAYRAAAGLPPAKPRTRVTLGRRPVSRDWPCRACKKARFETWEEHLEHQDFCKAA